MLLLIHACVDVHALIVLYLESPVLLRLVPYCTPQERAFTYKHKHMNTALCVTAAVRHEWSFCVALCPCVSFLSTLLTAVLSHHLAWVFTVTRQQVADGNNRHGKQSSKSVSSDEDFLKFR